MLTWLGDMETRNTESLKYLWMEEQTVLWGDFEN